MTLGYKKVVEELGVSLLNLNACEPVEVEIKEASVAKKVKISKPVLETDCLINVPVMKTHFLTSVTLGLKNLKGCLSGFEKSKFHKIGLHKAIADLNLAIIPKLTVIDAITAGEGMGPHFVDVIKMGLIIGSDDTLAADVVGATIMGNNPHEIEHLRIFAEREGRTTSLSDIHLYGIPIEDVKRSFKRPPPGSELTGGCSSDPRSYLQWLHLLTGFFFFPLQEEQRSGKNQGLYVCHGTEC